MYQKVGGTKVNQSYIKDISRLATMGQLYYTKHGAERMIERGCKRKDVTNILTSSTAEVVEIQKPTCRSPEERILVYDPNYEKDIIIVLTPDLAVTPKLKIITIEMADSTVWSEVPSPSAPPSIVRK